MNSNEKFTKNIREYKSSVGDLKDKMNKLLKMCDSTDFKQNEFFETLQNGLVNILDIKYFNSEIQKVYIIELINTSNRKLKILEKLLLKIKTKLKKKISITKTFYIRKRI
jgi:hypothetical protein